MSTDDNGDWLYCDEPGCWEKIPLELDATLCPKHDPLVRAEIIAARLVEVICEDQRRCRILMAAAYVRGRDDESAAAMTLPPWEQEENLRTIADLESRLANLRAQITREIAALEVLSWGHTDDCPGRPGWRGVCSCPKVPMIDRDAAVRVAQGLITREEFEAAKGPGRTDEDGKDVLYRNMAARGCDCTGVRGGCDHG